MTSRNISSALKKGGINTWKAALRADVRSFLAEEPNTPPDTEEDDGRDEDLDEDDHCG